MKKLSDAERLRIALALLTKREQFHYAELCYDLELNCERNGFYNVPEECEIFECNNCTMVDHSRREIDCPYVNESEVTDGISHKS